MPRIKPSSEAVRRRYREKLPEPQRQTFDQLARLIDHSRDDLAWHHEVGRLVNLLRPENPRGTEWSRHLAEALRPSRELLEKSLRFAELYEAEEIAVLEKLGVNWTRLYLSFVVRDPKARHTLLRRAVREGWSDRQLRFTIQQEHPSNRRGIGGR